MGFIEVLTLIFITLKLTGYIDWTWFQVLTPIMITVSVYLVAGVVIWKKVKSR